jgi:hypothetical protein
MELAVARRSIVAVLVAALVQSASAPAAAGTTWSLLPSPNSAGSNELLGAAASDASHVWAVGRVVTDTNPSSWRSLVLRWDGSAWTAAAHPHFAGNHMLLDVDAPGANDAWAVGTRQVASGGTRTVVHHWNGTRWRVSRTPNPDPDGLNQLLGVKSVPSDPSTVWAVGSYSNPVSSFGDLTLILQRAGGTWRTVPSPNVTADNHLEAVDATGPNNAWAVGWGSTSPFGGAALAIVLRWDGTRWRTVTIPDSSQVMLFGVEALAPNDMWAVGHTYVGGSHWIPLVLHWNGTAWTRATIPVPEFGGQLRDIEAISPTNVYAIGFAGEGSFADTLVLHWDGTSWSRQTTPSPDTGPKLYGAATVAPSTVWAAGYRYEESLLANQTLTLRTTTG